ncbi:pilus assembly PilX N-terminal domain-containing protein [Halorhodospira halochloris]|uniref:pilus assembly PilX N-terminal domain-containing protein n=1 Tax=Halorhodospira halochloris TaxID=1052 RepID=UPI001EE85DD4|nr:pilus assembly PilX N-terminal domain-containing protein [Halorhodospira halochloris]MCG5531108.1 pilus assembly PilX N-terminal domain-containing protein [Halorhodospira halochloris]MCG5549294.1 pilus assembly PilX N-terminal domain-containing protein [Halorhodospira halochloris]
MSNISNIDAYAPIPGGQRGGALIISIFVLVAVGLVTSALVNLVTGSADTSSDNLNSTAAFYAAESARMTEEEEIENLDGEGRLHARIIPGDTPESGLPDADEFCNDGKNLIIGWVGDDFDSWNEATARHAICYDDDWPAPEAIEWVDNWLAEAEDNWGSWRTDIDDATSHRSWEWRNIWGDYRDSYDGIMSDFSDAVGLDFSSNTSNAAIYEYFDGQEWSYAAIYEYFDGQEDREIRIGWSYHPGGSGNDSYFMRVRGFQDNASAEKFAQELADQSPDRDLGTTIGSHHELADRLGDIFPHTGGDTPYQVYVRIRGSGPLPGGYLASDHYPEDIAESARFDAGNSRLCRENQFNEQQQRCNPGEGVLHSIERNGETLYSVRCPGGHWNPGTEFCSNP